MKHYRMPRPCTCSCFSSCAPIRALCLRFAAALWPKRHKSSTSVIGARKESENENENEELNPVGVTDWVKIFVNNYKIIAL